MDSRRTHKSQGFFIEVTDEPLEEVAAQLLQPSDGHGDGAIVIFSGVVRDVTASRPVEGLEYEAYTQMAVDQMIEIAKKAAGTFAVTNISMVHRVGALKPGECSVLIAVSAPHRGPAFDACEFCIDTLKETVAIWKKELFSDGTSSWVNHP